MVRVQRLTVSICLFIFVLYQANGQNLKNFDIVVYGATPAGVMASVAAGREGQKVALIEPLPLVGGIMSGGLSFSDSNQMAREALGGLFREFHLRVERHYAEKGTTLPYSINESLVTKDIKPWTYEPHVAEKIFGDLLKEQKVEVMTSETLKQVEKEGNRITGIVLDSGQKLSAKVFIDATYEGDLMAHAGIKYRIGRESKDEFGESFAGARYPKKIVSVSAKGADGKNLPLVTATSRPLEGEGDNRVMTYSFRFCFSRDENGKVPLPDPVKYDPAEYEIWRRYFRAHPEIRKAFDLYVLPNNKLDGNNGIGLQLSLGLVGESTAYLEASAAERRRIWQRHRDYSEGLFYFLKTDDTVPAEIRRIVDKIGYAKDEFTDFDHFPPVLYVREGRRMEGEYLLTQADILKNVAKQDSIGVVSFPIDSHDCQRIALGDKEFINEGTIFPVRIKERKIGQPYQVPYRAITPKEAQCRNLLVPVGLSATHVAFSSVRVEPTWMVLGESAGIAAAIASEKNVAVQDVKYASLADRLTKRGQILELPDFALETVKTNNY